MGSPSSFLKVVALILGWTPTLLTYGYLQCEFGGILVKFRLGGCVSNSLAHCNSTVTGERPASFQFLLASHWLAIGRRLILREGWLREYWENIGGMLRNKNTKRHLAPDPISGR